MVRKTIFNMALFFELLQLLHFEHSDTFQQFLLSNFRANFTYFNDTKFNFITSLFVEKLECNRKKVLPTFTTFGNLSVVLVSGHFSPKRPGPAITSIV